MEIIIQGKSKTGNWPLINISPNIEVSKFAQVFDHFIPKDIGVIIQMKTSMKSIRIDSKTQK